LFLLPRGWPCPRLSITAPVSWSTTPASAIGRLCLGKRNPRWDLEEEDDAVEKAHNEGIRVFPGKLVYLIYKVTLHGPLWITSPTEVTGFDISSRREKGIAEKYIKEEKKKLAILQREKVVQKKNIWVYKRLQAPPYSLGGYYHRERLARTRRISTRKLQLGRWEDNIFEPIPKKLSTIASGATPIRSTGRAPDDNGQRWLMIKNIIDYFVDKNLWLYCGQNNIDYSHRELFAIIWRKSNSKILHTSTVKQGLQEKINYSQAKS
jgi:hypothetical protein